MSSKPTRKSVYPELQQACRNRGTTLTAVLNAVNRSDGNTGQWKAGSFPRLDVVMDIAEHIGVSLDELCYGENSRTVLLTESQQEWLRLIARIPEDRHQMCRDFLSTHAVKPEKYSNKRAGEKIS